MPAATNLGSIPAPVHRSRSIRPRRSPSLGSRCGLVAGVPNWVDLHTDLPMQSRQFYEQIFDWTYRRRAGLVAVPDDVGRVPTPWPGMVALSHGQPVAEIVERNETYGDLDLPARWVPYVRVDGLDAVLALVETNGGLVLSPPAPRGTMATVATILDPHDAMLCLWEPIDSVGSTTALGPGTMAWIELETPAVDVAANFYGELFGWKAEEKPPGRNCEHRGAYTVFSKDAEPVAGAVQVPTRGIVAAWSPSFSVIDVQATMNAVVRLGGVVMDEPCAIPVGQQAVIVDPSGATLSILGPRPKGPRPL